MEGAANDGLGEMTGAKMVSFSSNGIKTFWKVARWAVRPIQAILSVVESAWVPNPPPPRRLTARYKALQLAIFREFGKETHEIFLPDIESLPVLI